MSDTPHEKLFLAAAIIFYMIATIHIVRIVFGWTVAIDNHDVPIWLSWAMAVTCTYFGWRIVSLLD
jgi:hypothetical protein